MESEDHKQVTEMENIPGMDIDPSKTQKKSKIKKPKPEVLDDDGFAKPHQRNTRKTEKLKNTASGLNTSNEYNLLSGEESESSTTSLELKRKQPKKATNNGQLTSVVNQQQKNASNLKEVKRTKPIRIPSTSHPEIQTILGVLTLSQKPEVQKYAGNSYSISPRSVADKKVILKTLADKGIAHYTHSEPEDRHQIFVIKGHYNVKPDELLETLKSEDIPAMKVAQIGRSLDDPIYSVSFEKNTTNFHDLSTQHRVIGGLKIRWEKFQPKTKHYVQCKRCQAWGHGANNCNMPPRCVKCREHHEIGKCSRTSPDDPGEPSCVVCGESGHPANSKTCRGRAEYIKRIEKVKNKSTTQRSRAFISTPAPWANQNGNMNFNSRNFPSLPNNVNQSTNQLPQNVGVRPREYRTSLTQPRNIQPAQNNETFGLFSMQDELMVIPGMVETMKLYHQLKAKLISAPNPMAQLKVLFEFGLVI